MNTKKTPLIIIPGLGDWTSAYALVAIYWKLLGYDVHIFSFEWDNRAEDFDTAFHRLLHFIDKYHMSSVNIIGSSAGGTAAINALTSRPRIVNKVVTVATPYTHLSHLTNTKLKVSLDRLEHARLTTFETRILSIHGLHDQTVPVIKSQPRGVETQKIFVVRHIVIIALALTIYSRYIRHFFNKEAV